MYAGISCLKFQFDIKSCIAHGGHAVHFDSLIIVARRKDEIGIERRGVVNEEEVARDQRQGDAAQHPRAADQLLRQRIGDGQFAQPDIRGVHNGK